MLRLAGAPEYKHILDSRNFSILQQKMDSLNLLFVLQPGYS
jgi:hypothetical protein